MQYDCRVWYRNEQISILPNLSLFLTEVCSEKSLNGIDRHYDNQNQ